ncbi:hypothetical protein RA279_28775, partial [Pseudomonas syringae pv. tagetis]|uniref:hypothetical protein n=1 Tax=Pseudomonas syringae group genomosp. 7 TaxID=251699 RepID=UPI00376FE0F9
HVLSLDVAQYIKDALSKGAQAARNLHALQRLGVSGSPLEILLGEVCSVFEFLMPVWLVNS